MRIEDIDILDKNVLIIGNAGSGKTYLTSLINSENHNVLHTDDYIVHGFEQSMYKCLEDICKSGSKTIVEGIQGYRLLRKGVELKNYYPDVLIIIECSEQTQRDVYQIRGPEKIESILKMNKANETVFQKYLSMSNPQKPIIYKIENNR